MDLSATMAVKFRLQMALLLAVFFLPFPSSFVLCEGEPDEPPFSIVPSIGDEGNIFFWKHFTVVDYMAMDQCCLQMESRTDENYSHRLYLECAKGLDCTGAKLLVCYPSKLDPEAFPEEFLEVTSEGKVMPPIRRAYSSKWITNSNHEISKNCTKLMNECQKKDPDCPMPKMARESEEGEVWHGFTVIRQNGAFLLELPFGEGEESKSIVIPDPDDYKWTNSRFYIKFAMENNPENAFITQQVSDAKSTLFIDEQNENYHKHYLRNENNYMPMDNAAHLWVLGMDILATMEVQELRFYTDTQPQMMDIKVCVKKEGVLNFIGKKVSTHIHASYINPYAPNPAMTSKVKSEEQELNSDKSIKVYEKKDKIHIEELPVPLAESDFFVHGKVPLYAENFTVSLFLGRKMPTNYVGEWTINITVKNFDETTDVAKTCYIEPEYKKEPCNQQAKGKSESNDLSVPKYAFQRGQTFWLWFKIKDGKMEININCLLSEYMDPEIPYLLDNENWIMFMGDLELEFVAERFGQDSAVDTQNELTSVKGKSPILHILDRRMQKNSLFLIRGNLAEKAKIIEIKMVSLQQNEEQLLDNSTLALTFSKQSNCPLQTKFVCDNKCLQLNWVKVNTKIESGESCDSQKEGKTNDFNLAIACKCFPSSKQCIWQFNIKGQFIPESLLGIKEQDCSNSEINNIQVNGDLKAPIKMELLKFIPNAEKDNKITFKLERQMNIAEKFYVFGLIMKNDNKVKFEFLLNLICRECFTVPDKSTLNLKVTVKVTADGGSFVATTFETKRPKPEERGKKDKQEIETKSGNANFVAGKPFSLKMDNSETHLRFFLNENDNPIIEIKAPQLVIHGEIEIPGEYISVEGDILLMNAIVPMPYRKLLNSEGTTVAMNSTIEFSGMLVRNAQIFELFLARMPASENIYYETWKLIEGEYKDGIYLHIKTEKSIDNMKFFCINSEQQKGICKKEWKYPNPIKKEEFFSMKIQLKKKVLDVTINNANVAQIDTAENYREYTKDKEGVEHGLVLVINGDIIFFDPIKTVSDTDIIMFDLMPRSEKDEH